MKSEDLTRLRIQRAPSVDPASSASLAGRKPWLRYLLFALVLVGAYWAYAGLRETAIEVETGTAATMFPSQAFTLLNASGYVVPQTKADVASKATGRLETLEVEEGSAVKAGQILARIENRDMVAALNQAEANVRVAKTQLQRAEAELREATLALNRAKTLAARKFVSPEAVDTETARHARAVAAVDSAKANIEAAEAARGWPWNIPTSGRPSTG